MESGLRYTLCFIRRGDEILMLNRQFSSWMGSWNGVGGSIEDDESPEECILREAYEETDIKLSDVRDCGILTWDTDNNEYGGMHLFLSDVPDDFVYDTPRSTKEGILDWKKISWILHPENTGVVENIQRFLPKMLGSDKRYRYACIYEGNDLVEFLNEEME